MVDVIVETAKANLFLLNVSTVKSVLTVHPRDHPYFLANTGLFYRKYGDLV